MSTTTTVLTTTDILPSSVPKLLLTGLNWTMFSIHFQEAIKAKGFWGHFDGSVPQPSVSDPPTAAEAALAAQWDKDECSAKALLTHCIPDSTLVRVYAKLLLKECWDLVVTKYTKKGLFAQADLHTRFMELRCPDKGNVREFLDALRVKKEELSTYGVTIDQKDYRSTIISSLPMHLSNFALNLLAGMRLYSSLKTIDLDSLIMLISEESECNVSQCSCRSA